MKSLFINIIMALFLSIVTMAKQNMPQVPPKITRPTKSMSKPNVNPRTPVSHRQSSQSSRPTSQRVNLKPLKNRIFMVDGVKFKMVGVQGGTFQMGSNNGEDREKPVHNVTLSSYYIGQTEVTQALWKAVMGSNPSSFKGDNLPVETVSWNDCQTFITELNQLTGKHFRLPTEAEWEFAAKGGIKSKGYIYSGSNTLSNVAWYFKTHTDTFPDHFGTFPVATKSSNELGIYDMSGNVWEWCHDWFIFYSSCSQTNPVGTSGSSHVVRGGSFCDVAMDCRSACRRGYAPGYRDCVIGLRLVLSE